VLECNSVEQERLRLKKYADFEIKPIEKPKILKQLLNEKQTKLLIWLSEYYFASIGLFARIFLAKKFDVRSSKFKINNLILTPKTKGLVFAPFKNLKSITIKDSESDLYQSWGRRPYYNVKDIAIQLAKIHNAKLTLKTNLPSIETYYYAKKKKYELVTQDTKYKIQDTNIVDMRKEILTGNFSPISKELQEKIANSAKTILFIARRGTSTIVLCRECGYIAKCQSCDIPMVFHEDKPSRRLVCHHCGKDDIAPVLCPNCKSIKIKYLGTGTQKVESEIKKLFSNKKIFRLDGDVSKKPAEQQKIITEFNNNNEAILIGSQMLLNKGLKANLVAIISIDTILNLPDFKSLERTFEIIGQFKDMVQPATSASRKQAGPPNCEAVGGFLIQTYGPENEIFKLAIENNFNKFYNDEIKVREKYNYPPFSEIIKLSYSHKDFVRAKNEALVLKNKLEQQIKYKIQDTRYKIQIFGPNPAFISKEKGLYKWNIIIKSQLTTDERNKILIIVPATWEININPGDTL
jgi:primosomal protein N' (replication factor Y)